MSRKTRTEHVPLALGLIVALLLATACGSTTSGGKTTGASADVAAARAAVVAAEKPPTGFTSPGPPVDATKVRGKKVWVVAPLSIPLAKYFTDGLKEATGLVGMTVHLCDGAAEVSPTASCISAAVASHADLIFTANVEPPALTAPIEEAAAHHIPVIAIEEGEPGEKPPTSGWPSGVAALLNQCHACAGKLMADAAIADSNGKADVRIIWSSDVTRIGVPQVNAIKAEFRTRCPGCKVETVNVPIPQWATGLGTATRTAIASDPNVDYLLPVYDGMAPFIVPAVAAAGAQSRVKVVTFNATPSVLKDLAAGNVVAADVGSNALQWGWYWADEAFRVLSGVPPSLREAPPQRIFTKSNIGSINLSASQVTWYGPPTYQAAFKKLWGLD